MQRKIVRGLLTGLLAFALALTAHFLGLTRPLEWKSWDWRVRLFADEAKAGRDIAVVLIDQYSLDVYQKQQGITWPWPRQMYSALIDYFKKGGAKACFIDMDLSASSPFGSDDDQDLSSAMSRAQNVFLPISLSAEQEEAVPVSPDRLKPFSYSGNGVPARALRPVKAAGLPVEPLLKSVRGVGNVLFTPDADGIFRRLPLLFLYKNLILPSVPLAVADFLGKDTGPWKVPLDPSGQMILRFHGPSGTYRTYSAAALINSWARIEEGKPPQVPAEEFAGKIVLVGGSAAGILDLRPTPLSAVSPGVEINATAVDNLLRGDCFRTPAPVVLWLMILACSLAAGIGTSYLRKIWHLSLFFLFCLALPAAAAGAAYTSGFWLDFVAPEAGSILAFIGASLLNFSTEGRQRRFIKNVFRHYLSPHVIEQIIENPSLLKLGGEKREITSFFSDVAGFTPISESLPPERLVNLLNAYLSEMTDIILSTGGTLDKYEGDAIIAFWNAPLDQPDHASRACRTALACQKRLSEIRPRFFGEYGHEVFMRIGLNSGPAVVGNMGSDQRFDYTAMGDTVNLASRLEGASKRYKVPVLIGEQTFHQIKETFIARKVDVIRVVGKAKPVTVYEVIGEKDSVPEDVLTRVHLFSMAMEAYGLREWDRAALLFGNIEGDPLSSIYAERCLSLRQSPPPDGWDGILDLKEK